MALALDRELADFFNFLGHQVGLANVWIALSADHGVSALPDAAKSCAFPPPIWMRVSSKRKLMARRRRSFRRVTQPLTSNSTIRLRGSIRMRSSRLI